MTLGITDVTVTGITRLSKKDMVRQRGLLKTQIQGTQTCAMRLYPITVPTGVPVPLTTLMLPAYQIVLPSPLTHIPSTY